MPMSMVLRWSMGRATIIIPGSTVSIIRGPGHGVLASATILMSAGRLVLAMALAGSMPVGVLAITAGAAGAAVGGVRRLTIRHMPGAGIGRRGSMAPGMPATGMCSSTIITRISI